MCLKKIIPYLLLLTLLLVANAMIDAGSQETGRIQGTLTNIKTGDPVVGASIMVVGTSTGAISDFDGKYLIKRLRPGVYSLRISHLDFNTEEVTNIVVTADTFTVISVQLTKSVKEIGKTIEVTAKHDILDKFKTSNQVVIGKEQKKTAPVTTVDELLSSVSGVVTNDKGEVFIKGGRAYEVGYIVDGAPMGDPVTGLGQSEIQLQSVPQSGKRYTRIYRPTPAISSNDNLSSPAHGGNAIVNGEPFDAMFFKNYGVNPFVDTEDDRLSTFAIDVDDASYVMARSYLKSGNLPPNEAIRTEEFVNHFKYNYAPPRNQPFSIFFEGAPSKFGSNSQLIKIGIKGKEIAKENRKDANLVFVVDISGSMSSGNRLGLVRKALRMLVDELNQNDKVGIVVYGSRGEVRLQPTSIRNRAEIIRAIESLNTAGATNAEQGIKMGYEMAQRYFESGKINRIILCSDGVANVGTTGPDQILKQIKKYADQGITLSAIGFGMGNYNDVLMEKLGNKGNGSYAYVDDIKEAKRIFIENLTGNLQVIARDVKIQVDFNPQVVRSYRLLGYENRDVADNKFRDDKEDGGEIGAGHEVTALYEVKFHKQIRSDYVGTVYVRYKDDSGKEVSEINRGLRKSMFHSAFQNASYEFKLATVAAEYAEILRKSYWAKGSDPQDLLNIAAELLGERQSDELIELIGMIAKTKRFEESLAQN